MVPHQFRCSAPLRPGHTDALLVLASDTMVSEPERWTGHPSHHAFSQPFYVGNPTQNPSMVVTAVMYMVILEMA